MSPCKVGLPLGNHNWRWGPEPSPSRHSGKGLHQGTLRYRRVLLRLSLSRQGKPTLGVPVRPPHWQGHWGGRAAPPVMLPAGTMDEKGCSL